jgi:hypothetical protein
MMRSLLVKGHVLVSDAAGLLGIVLCAAVLAASAGTAGAALYSWENDKGVRSYTDDPVSIPSRYKGSMRLVEGDPAPPPPAEEQSAPEEQKKTEPPPRLPARIEGMTLLGSSGGFSYYFDRTRVVKAGSAATLQFAFGILEVDETSGDRKDGSLNIICRSGETITESVSLPEEYSRSLREKFCIQGEGGEAKP